MGVVDLKHGHFSWFDLMSHNLEEAKSWYGNLFGWTFDEAPSDPSGPPYMMIRQGDYFIGGMSEASAEMKAGGMPPVWNSYVQVDDADAMAARATELGGTILMPPMDAQDVGRMTIIQDPTGAALMLWQVKKVMGETLFNEPNALTWNELMTRDQDAARSFYTELFGWGWQEMDMGGDVGMYYVCTVDGAMNGGVMKMPAEIPEQVPSHWTVYIAVDDVDAMTEKVTASGGTVMVEPMDIPVGRMSGVQDPQGAFFYLFKGASPQE